MDETVPYRLFFDDGLIAAFASRFAARDFKERYEKKHNIELEMRDKHDNKIQVP
jgi:hypothetical protein